MMALFEFGKNNRLRIELVAALAENMSPERLRHSFRVAKTAAVYARALGLPADDAWIAGMAHDFAREWPAHQLLQFVLSHDGQVSGDMRLKPLLLHGRAAAILLQKNFKVDKPDILEAMEHHTLGRAGMSPLAKLLFAADYLEPGRRFTTVRFRRSVRKCCLDCLVCQVIEHCAKRHKDIHGLTAALYNESLKHCSRGSCPGPHLAPEAVSLRTMNGEEKVTL